MAVYMVLNESKKRARSVSREFKQYQFFEKENKLNAMKRRFKTNKILTAVNETKHTVTTSEGNILHEKIASKPIKFQLSKKPEEKRRPTHRCIRCGKFSQGNYCDTHKRVYGVPKDTDEPSCSYTLPTMPDRKKVDLRRHHRYWHKVRQPKQTSWTSGEKRTTDEHINHRDGNTTDGRGKHTGSNNAAAIHASAVQH